MNDLSHCLFCWLPLLLAPRHGCPDVCITVINNMYGYNAMEVQEAFVKIKEQARAYLALPQDLRAGGRAAARHGIQRQTGGCRIALSCCSADPFVPDLTAGPVACVTAPAPAPSP